MFCYKCGKQLDDSMAFCPDCGTEQQKVVKNTLPINADKFKLIKNMTTHQKKLFAIVGVVLLILCTIAGGFVHKNAKKEAMVKALIGTTWSSNFASAEDGIAVWSFVDEDTFMFDIGQRFDVREVKWWVKRVTDDTLIFNAERISPPIYDEVRDMYMNIGFNGDHIISFKKVNGSYIPYALIYGDGTVLDTQF